MARVTPEEFQEKHARRLKGASEDIRRGIQRVNVAPGVLAAKAKDLMRQRLNASIDNGTWERTVAAVPKEEWQRQAIDKGIGRIGAGIDGAKDKVTNMAAKLLPAVDAAVAEVNKIPKGDIEASVARAGAFMRGMNKRKIR